jgi:shikimate kinase
VSTRHLSDTTAAEAADAEPGSDETPRSIALVGLMGAGKSSVGARVAAALGWTFVDSDSEIEEAAKMSIPDIFDAYGEAEFRALERRVIARLLSDEPIVLATGGGAFMHPETRALMKQKAVTVWLRADIEVLLKRVGRRNDRPLLAGDDPRAVMERLMAERHPIYAEADLTVESHDGPQADTVRAVLDALGEAGLDAAALGGGAGLGDLAQP